MEYVHFNSLLYSASKSLKGQAFPIARNDRGANDQIQETLLKALKYKSKFKEGTNIKAWLFIILRNTFIADNPKDKKYTAVDAMVDPTILNTTTTISYNEGETNIRTAEIYKAIDKLDKTYRVPFMMHFSGFKYDEIADNIGIPIGTVKNRIHVARKMLMHNLNDFNI